MFRAIAVATLVVGTLLAGLATAGSETKITICHKPHGEARTLQVSANSWEAHRGHGDHREACAPPGTPPTTPPTTPPPPPPAQVSLATKSADGRVDGSAVFAFTVANDGAVARGVRVTGVLHGDGAWSMRDDRCTIDGQQLSCVLGDLRPGASIVLRLRFATGPDVCEYPSVELMAAADNDGSGHDNWAEQRVSVGACAVWRD